MPQMAPLNWIFIFFMMMTLFLIMKTSLNKTQQKTVLTKMFKSMKKTMKW